MRRVPLLLALILLFAGATFGQSTTLSGTIVDAGSQAWKSGTYFLTFQPSPSNPTAQYYWNGAPFNKNQTLPAAGPGSMDATGAFSVSVPSNTSITPSGSTWQLTVCPEATSPCYSTTLTVTGSTQSVNSVVPPVIAINLSVTPGSFTRAYMDSEIVSAVVGASYYNLTTPGQRYCTAVTGQTCTAWAAGSGGGSLSGVSVASGVLINTNDFETKGPNPYTDARAYGVRTQLANATPVIPGLTANISSGSALAVISTNSCPSQVGGICFKVGDGAVIYNGGPTITMSTPSAPTVTPSLTAGLTGSLLDVASSGGLTSYSYQVVACDPLRGCTAASAAGTTTTGVATLGEQTIAVSSISLANNITGATIAGIVTVNTSSAHNLAAGATFNMSGVTATNGTGPNPFNGWFEVNTVTSATQFTYYVNSNPSNGSASAGTGGTVASWNDNHVTWPACTGCVNGAIYKIYRNSTLIGISWPQNFALAGDTTYLAFDDFGPTVTSLPNPPYWASLTPPATATNDMLVSTITGITGTSLTLANNASNNVTAGTILFDDAVTFKAAVTAAGGGSTILIPYGGVYVFNSPQTYPSQTGVFINGKVLINETQNISNSTLRGTSDFGAQPSFAWKGDPQVVCGTANPCLYSTNTAYLFDLTLSNNSANGANMVVFDLTSNIPGPTLDNINFSLSNGTDYSNMALLFRGTHTASGCCSTFNNVLFSSTQNGNLTSTFPAFYVDNGGDIKFTNLFFSGKGMLLRPTVSASYIDADVIYSQGNYMPYFTLSNQLGGGTASVAVRAATCIFDTTFQPLIANLGGLAVGLDEQLCTNTAGNSAVVTGVPTISTNEGLSQNLAARFTSSPTTFDGAYYNNVTVGPGTVPQMLYDNSVNVGPAFSSFVQDAVPAAPTCATASAGPPYTPVGTWTFKFDWIYANSGVGNLSPASASCTANGTSQQITITLPSTPQAAGAPGAFIYASTNTGAGPWATMGSTQPTTTTQTHVYTETFTVYAAPTGAGSGPVGMGPSGLLWGKNIASNSGTPCNPAYFDLTDYIISTSTAYEGACYSGATPDVQMNACNTAMLASTTTNSTCDLRNFGGQQSGAGIFLQNEVDFGNNSGFGGAIIAPDSCRWFVSTNSTSAYGIRLYKGMSLVNNAPGSSGNCGVQAAAGSVFNYLFGTDTSQPANSYGLIRGFAVKNFVTVPNSGVTAIIQGYFDNFMAENFFVSCGGYTIASGTNTCLEVTGVSSAATFLNLQVNGNQGAGIIPFQDIATGTTSRAAGDGQTFINFNCTHPGVNLNCAQFIDTAAPSGYRTATNIMSGYYESHNGASTAAHFYVNNWGSFSLNHSVFNLQSASFTAPLLEVTYSTQITHVSFCDITVNGGSGVTPTFPYLIYQNDVTGQKVYTDQTGHYSKCYSNSTEAQGVNPIAYSTTPAMDVSLGSIQQFACTTAGAAIVPTIANLQAGIEFTVIFVQNGTTACTWTWPSTIHGATAVSATLNSVSVQKLIVSNNGTDAYAESATVGTTGGTP